MDRKHHSNHNKSINNNKKAKFFLSITEKPTAKPNADNIKMQRHFQLNKQQMKNYSYLQKLHSSKKLIQGPLNSKLLGYKDNIFPLFLKSILLLACFKKQKQRLYTGKKFKVPFIFKIF